MTSVRGLLTRLLGSVEAAGSTSRANIVAFSGGVDSSLVAKIVKEVFPASAIAAVGVSAALSSSQLANAREVAKHIGIELHEVETAEGNLDGYIENKGQSCYYCKRTLYETLSRLAAHYEAQVETPGSSRAILYNGTNKDDGVDPTRVGLKAAAEFQVSSPLLDLSKQEVRAVAKYLDLPNWNLAAAPCLVSEDTVLVGCLVFLTSSFHRTNECSFASDRALPLAWKLHPPTCRWLSLSKMQFAPSSVSAPQKTLGCVSSQAEGPPWKWMLHVFQMLRALLQTLVQCWLWRTMARRK